MKKYKGFWVCEIDADNLVQVLILEMVKVSQQLDMTLKQNQQRMQKRK